MLKKKLGQVSKEGRRAVKDRQDDEDDGKKNLGVEREFALLTGYSHGSRATVRSSRVAREGRFIESNNPDPVFNVSLRCRGWVVDLTWGSKLTGGRGDNGATEKGEGAGEESLVLGALW